MKQDTVTDMQHARQRDHLIRTAERVLAQAYRSARREEMLASQLRVRECIVHEMLRRAR